MKPINVNGLKGCLLMDIDNSMYFRVYNKDKTFNDYDLNHSDLQIIIDDEDAYSYTRDDGTKYIDHSPETLGIKYD